jgi:dTMP kinase
LQSRFFVIIDARGAFVFFSTSSHFSSHLHLNHQPLHQVKAEMWRFPDRTTEIGTMINAYLARSKELDDAAVHLLFSANRWEKRAELLRELSKGTTLVCDRYAFSGVAFTAAKQKTGMGFDWCRAPDQGLPAPDAVLYLDLAPAEAEKRGGFGEERYESREMLSSVREAFDEIAAFVDGRCTRWVRVDASGSVEEVGERVGAAARAAVEAAAQGGVPLRSLWDGSAGVVGWPLKEEEKKV